VDLPRAVLLDAFGTLLELEQPVPLLRAGLRERLGLEVSAEEAAAALRAEIAFYRAHHDEARDAATLARLRRTCARVLRGALPPSAHAVPLDELLPVLLGALRFRTFPEVPAALSALRSAGARLVVVSNWDVSLPDALDAAGIARLLDGTVVSAEVGAAKPAPEIFERGLELAGARPEEAMHVGDSFEHDVVGARAAGIEPVLVVRGESAVPSGVRAIRSLAELAGAEPYP
jgi:putative hydrolase of the HAD superfamily